MIKKISFLSLLFAMFGMSLITSCSTDDLDDENIDFTENFTYDLEKNEGEARENDCFELVFPISFTMPDGSILDVEEDQSIRELLSEWKENNPDVEGKPELNLPITVILNETGEELVLSSHEEIRNLKKDCGFGKGKGKHGGKRKCFEIQLPVSFTTSDGSTITVEEGQSIKDVLKEYKENNPDVESRPELNFPITVILKEDGLELAIDSEEELKELKEECHGKKGKGHKERCFELQLPVSFTAVDGTIITVEEGQSIREVLKAYKENNPDVESRPELNFPVTVVLKEDGSEIEVNSEDELRELKDNCED